MKLNLENTKLMNINRASVTISYKGDIFFMVKRKYNELLHTGEIEGEIITKKFVNKFGAEIPQKWFAQLSIF